MATLKEIFEGNTSKVLEATELLKVLGDREGQFVWKQLTVDGGDFIAFVTADNENSYPDGGMQDGYWYELVEEGVSGIVYGVFTPTANMKTTTIQHGLGVVPSAIYMLSENMSPNASGRIVALKNETPIYVNDTSGKTFKFTGLSVPTFTENDVTITISSSSSIYFGASIAHYWFVTV